MSRKMKYDPNLYGEGKGGTYDVVQSENFFMMSNKRLGSMGFMIRCFFCEDTFKMWSNRENELREMAKADGWERTNARHWICPKCRKLPQPNQFTKPEESEGTK